MPGPLFNNLMNIGTAQAFSVDLASLAMAQSIGILMGNAVTAEQNSQVLQNACVSQCCALIVSAGIAGAVKPAQGV